MKKSPENVRRMEDVLSESEVYRDDERAFTEGMGLPLHLQAPLLHNLVRYDKKQKNPFCAILRHDVKAR